MTSISPQQAADRCRRLGTATMALAAAVALLIVVAALLVGGAFGAVALSAGLAGTGMAVLAGLTLRNAVTRSGGFNPDRLRTVRRALVYFCVAAAFCFTGLLVAALAMGPTAAGFALLLLAALPIALTATAAVAGHQQLRAS